MRIRDLRRTVWEKVSKLDSHCVEQLVMGPRPVVSKLEGNGHKIKNLHGPRVFVQRMVNIICSLNRILRNSATIGP